jgi:toxin ParE1/3/4
MTIKADLDQLATFPLSGPSREQLAPGLRVMFRGSYAIYYMPAEQEIVVIRVLHGARDIDALANRGGFAE